MWLEDLYEVERLWFQQEFHMTYQLWFIGPYNALEYIEWLYSFSQCLAFESNAFSVNARVPSDLCSAEKDFW